MKEITNDTSADGARKHPPGEAPAREPTPAGFEWLSGDQDEESLKALVSLVQVELQALASRMRRGFSPPPSLETVELVGEMYVRLFDGKVPDVCDRNHFFNIAARTMRWILVGRHRRLKPEVLADLTPISNVGIDEFDLEALDAALEELSSVKPELARLVDLSYFLGLAPAEIAEVTKSSERTVYRDLKRARSWLYWRLGDEAAEGGGPA